MLKFLKYFFILLAAVCIVFLLFSCTAKKKTPPVPTGEPTESMKAARFGHLYVDACAQRMKGNLNEALSLFEECRQIDPYNAAVHYELGTILKLLGQTDRALGHAKFCAARDPGNEWYQLLYIDCLTAKGLYAQAVKAREALVKKFPDKHDFREDLAIAYAQTGQYEKALKLYEELERIMGVSEQLTLNKVKLLKTQGNMQGVEEELQRLSRSDRREVRYYNYLAEFYTERGRPELARQMYDSIIRVDPANGHVNLALHDHYSAAGDKEKAHVYLEKAFESPEIDVNVKASILGNFYIQTEAGDRKAAEQGRELAGILIAVHPEAAASNALFADFLMLDKKIAEAAPYYFRAALAESRDHRVWENLLFVDNELGRFDSLERHSAMAIELFPSHPRHYLYQGVASSRLGKTDKALRALEDGVAYIIDDRPLMLDFLRLMGDLYHTKGDHARSDKAFEDALRIDSDDRYVLNNYAYYLSLRGEKLDLAEKLASRANRLSPGNRSYMDTYGWVLYRMKRYTEAVEWLSRAAAAAQPGATILEHYGDALYRSGDAAGALKQWMAAKEAGGNSPALLDKISKKRLDD